MTAPARHTTRFAASADIDAVARLLRMMDEYYRPGDILPDLDAYAAMVTRTITAAEGTRFVLCIHDDEPAGLGCLAVLRPGRNLSGLVFIKDLYVRDEFRGRGLGSALMRFIADFAVRSGIGRIDLATDQGNDGALKLYERLGGVRRPAVYFNFPEDALRKLAAER